MNTLHRTNYVKWVKYSAVKVENQRRGNCTSALGPQQVVVPRAFKKMKFEVWERWISITGGTGIQAIVIVLHSITVVCPRLLTVGDSVVLFAFLFFLIVCAVPLQCLWRDSVTYLQELRSLACNGSLTTDNIYTNDNDSVSANVTVTWYTGILV